MKTKLVIIGAGSASFTRGILRELVASGETIDIGLVDTNPQALETAARLAKKMITVKQAPITVSASLDRRDVLSRATAVLSTLAVGGRRAQERDVFISRKFNVFHAVGDTVMPAGASRALRMVPVMVELARDVLDLAPQALFVNYANPMTAICRAVRKETGANIIGLCHALTSRQRVIAWWLGKDLAELSFDYAGLNHLTWLHDVKLNERSLKPKLKQIAAERLAAMESGHDVIDQPVRRRGYRRTARSELDDLMPATWQLFDLFDAIAIPFDRHITEFFPWLYCGPAQYFGSTLGVNVFSFEESIHNGDRSYAQIQEDAYSSRNLPDSYFMENEDNEPGQFVAVMQAAADGKQYYLSANLPNGGRLPDLPEESCLEAPAVAEAGGVRPRPIAPLPAAITSMLASRLQWVEVLIEAAMEGSREKFVQALVLDGAVRDLGVAHQLADELLTAQQEYLPQFATTNEHVASQTHPTGPEVQALMTKGRSIA